MKNLTKNIICPNCEKKITIKIALETTFEKPQVNQKDIDSVLEALAKKKYIKSEIVLKNNYLSFKLNNNNIVQYVGYYNSKEYGFFAKPGSVLKKKTVKLLFDPLDIQSEKKLEIVSGTSWTAYNFMKQAGVIMNKDFKKIATVMINNQGFLECYEKQDVLSPGCINVLANDIVNAAGYIAKLYGTTREMYGMISEGVLYLVDSEENTFIDIKGAKRIKNNVKKTTAKPKVKSKK